MIGRTFSGRYRIVERIGIGGMAEVYRAQDTVLGRIVAVKVMLPQYAADADFTRRFRQEAAAAANLQSPYIVNVYDWGQDEGTYYIVMEYVRGGDLKTAIKERGAINQRKVAEIASQSCQALSVAHGQDIVHRDIKPQNIMVQPDGNVKVMDFGIARAKNSVKTQTSSVLGTAHYISPEQAQGKELTAASDIYSLGVCMYEAITGQLPFDGPDAVSVAMKQVNEKPKPLHEIFPGVDPVLEAIVLRAMQKDPIKRFPTALDMRRVLNDYLAGRARGTAAAAAILAGTGAVAAAAQNNVNANDVTHRINPNADQQTQLIGGGAVGPQTSVIPQGVQQGGGQPGGAGWNGQTGVINQGGQGGQGGNQGTVYRGGGGNTKKKHPVRNTIIVLLILALLCVGGYFAYGMFFNQPIAVPDVKGKTLEEATKDITEAEYLVGEVTEEYSDDVESGKVINTDPEAGKKLDRGSKVDIILSKGKEQVTVPNVVGMDEATAKRVLSDAGLEPAAGKAKYSDTVAKGSVISTKPAAETQVDKGSKVTYVLSKGVNNVEVPWVVGQTQDTAYTNLTNDGFEVVIVDDYSDDYDEGIVCWQDPAGEEKIKKGSTVTICVSLGSELVNVPNVVGDSVANARATLENAGFNVTMTEDYSGSAIVSGQSTQGQAKKGATVNLTAEEPQPEPEPSSSSSGGYYPPSTSSSSDDDEEDEDDDF